MAACGQIVSQLSINFDTPPEMCFSYLSMDHGVLSVDNDLSRSRDHEGGHQGLRVLALLGGVAIDKMKQLFCWAIGPRVFGVARHLRKETRRSIRSQEDMFFGKNLNCKKNLEVAEIRRKTGGRATIQKY